MKEKIGLLSPLIFCLFTFIGQASAEPVVGYVDLHNHLMAEYSFGGNWYWGNVEGAEEVALRKCDGGWASKHGVFDNLLLSEITTNYHKLNCPKTGSFLDKLSCGDTGIHLGKRNGYETRKECLVVDGKEIAGTCPKENYIDWPRWDTHAHQQMWEGWIKHAHEKGLQVMVVSFTESNFLCEQTYKPGRKYSCDEMESVRRQIAMANQFVDHNQTWVGLATSAAKARELIASGKLALVYAVEITNLFSEGDIGKQLDEFYQLGVRSIQPVHHANNRFAGAVPIPRLNKVAAAVDAINGTDMTHIDEVYCVNKAGESGICDGHEYLNMQGLTADGVRLVKLMMAKGMLVDVAHASRKSIIDIVGISQYFANYPLLYSHAHFFETVDPSTEINEKFIMPNEIELIKKTGGMVGLRTGPEKSVQYQENPVVLNNCQGSSRSFAQHLMYGIDHGLSIAFGTDMNTFIEQIIPRFGNKQETCWGNPIEQEAQKNNRNTVFDRNGLAHIGLLPELMRDLTLVGLPQKYIDHLNGSAERFLVMWKQAEIKSKAPATLPARNYLLL